MVRYILAGGLLFVLDYAVTHMLYIHLQQPLTLTQWAGRLVGAGVGYFLHRWYTFPTAGTAQASAPARYWLVAVGLWLVSPLLLSGAMAIFPASFLLAKVATEGLLVVSSYLLLRHYVFHSSQKQ